MPTVRLINTPLILSPIPPFEIKPLRNFPSPSNQLVTRGCLVVMCDFGSKGLTARLIAVPTKWKIRWKQAMTFFFTRESFFYPMFLDFFSFLHFRWRSLANPQEILPVGNAWTLKHCRNVTERVTTSRSNESIRLTVCPWTVCFQLAACCSCLYFSQSH